MENIKLIDRQIVSKVLESFGISIENDSYYETILKNRDQYIDQLSRELKETRDNYEKTKQKLERTTEQLNKLFDVAKYLERKLDNKENGRIVCEDNSSISQATVASNSQDDIVLTPELLQKIKDKYGNNYYDIREKYFDQLETEIKSLKSGQEFKRLDIENKELKEKVTNFSSWWKSTKEERDKLREENGYLKEKVKDLEKNKRSRPDVDIVNTLFNYEQEIKNLKNKIEQCYFNEHKYKSTIEDYEKVYETLELEVKRLNKQLEKCSNPNIGSELEKYKNLWEKQKESTRRYKSMIDYLQEKYSGSGDNFVRDRDFLRKFIGVLSNCDDLLEDIDSIYKSHIVPEICREELAPYVTIIGKDLIEYLKNLGSRPEEEKIITKIQGNISAIREIIYSLDSYIV